MIIHLISSSPRRLEILTRLGFTCLVEKHGIDEENWPESQPEKRAGSLALEKLRSFLQRCPSPLHPVLAVDTLLSFQSLSLEKPQDRAHAHEMLSRLSGQTHEVITALAFYHPRTQEIWEHISVTQVVFRTLSDKLINEYLDADEWQDAAGAYKIQGRGEILIERIHGLPSTVVGLPIPVIYDMIRSVEP